MPNANILLVYEVYLHKSNSGFNNEAKAASKCIKHKFKPKSKKTKRGNFPLATHTLAPEPPSLAYRES